MSNGAGGGADGADKFRVGLKVICQDQFPSKYTGKTMFKWRPAEIVALETRRGSSQKTTRVKVHFDMWSDRHDIWLDLHTQWDRLGLRGDLGEEERKASDVMRLGPRQRARIRDIVTRTTGKAPEEKAEPVGDADGLVGEARRASSRGRDNTDSGGGQMRVSGGGGRRSPASERSSDMTASAHSVVGDDSDSDNDMIGLAPDPDADDRLDDTVGLPGVQSRKLVRKASFDPGYQPRVGDQIDVLDQYNNKDKKREEKWRAAKVREVRGQMLLVHFVGWDDQWDVFVNYPSGRVAPPGSMVQSRSDERGRRGEEEDVAGEEGRLEEEEASRRNRRVRGSRGSRESDSGDEHHSGGRRGKRRSRSEMNNERAGDSDSDGSDVGNARALRDNVNRYRRGLSNNTAKDGGDRDSDGDRDDGDGGGERGGTDTDDTYGASSAGRSYRTGGRRQSRARRRSEARMAAALARQRRGGDASSNDGRGGGGSEREFLRSLSKKGMQVVEMEADGNCLFRAVCHQIYDDPERHPELRRQVAAHMEENRERFSIFCTNDFSVYLERIRRNGVWGDDLEIRAMEELIDRSIEIYVAESKEDGTVEPLKTNFDEELTGADVTPIKLSYHGSSHYNSVVDERHPLPIAPRDTSVIYDVRHKRHMDEPPPATQSSSRRSSFGMTMRGGGWRRKKR